MGITCIINFDNNPHGTYFAGQVVSGQITLKLDKIKLVKALTLTISGFAETEWTESTGTGKDETTDTYRGREDYIASQTYLAGSSQSTQVSIEPGVHVYNFSCQIPPTCPSSIEGLYGRVRYMIKVAMVKPWKFDQSYTRCFTVLKIMDLNYDSPLLRMPTQMETQKVYCCWPCTSAPMQLQMTLPQTGYVSGQIIPVGMLVTNDSHIAVEALQVNLAMMVTYHATHMSRTHSRNERLLVTKLMGDPVPHHCKKQFTYYLRVPATAPTCFNLCKIIQIAYQVEVEARVKGCHRNQAISIPITLGSVPLLEHPPMQPQPRDLDGLPPQELDAKALGHSAVVPQASAPPAEFNAPWAIDGSIPPPNYEEAIHMRTQPDGANNIQATAPPNTLSLDEHGFAPLYPIFNIPSPTGPSDPKGPPNTDVNANKGTWL
ncbi:PREDICTED: arrestin domain-containing protein 2-like [Drosophila arizonae]|uniref:Arrestin domain-containing protein 2-like n=1 Tax=Drosophila arizonae TaxID=7263 RepID=A0ABM1NMD0_DROAR|nr:PREDICTED: arrestin domain-containing protein 2-like [Drosophila arizonae]